MSYSSKEAASPLHHRGMFCVTQFALLYLHSLFLKSTWSNFLLSLVFIILPGYQKAWPHPFCMPQRTQCPTALSPSFSLVWGLGCVKRSTCDICSFQLIQEERQSFEPHSSIPPLGYLLEKADPQKVGGCWYLPFSARTACLLAIIKPQNSQAYKHGNQPNLCTVCLRRFIV